MNAPVQINQNQGELILNENIPFNQKIAVATDVANSLSTLIKEQKMFSKIQSKPHVNIEGWRTLGLCLGLHAELEGKVEPVEWGYDTFEKPIGNGKTKSIRFIGFEATTVIKNIQGDILGRQSAVCTNEEKGKESNASFAIYSMVETRSESRAWRQVLDWVMKLAGFETTPVEEMNYTTNNNGDGAKSKAPTPPKTPKKAEPPKEPTEPANVQEADFKTKKPVKEEVPITDTTPPATELELEQEKTISNDKIGNEAINRLIQKKETINQENLVDEVRNMVGEEVISPAEAGRTRKLIANA